MYRRNGTSKFNQKSYNVTIYFLFIHLFIYSVHGILINTHKQREDMHKDILSQQMGISSGCPRSGNNNYNCLIEQNNYWSWEDGGRKLLVSEDVFKDCMTCRLS